MHAPGFRWRPWVSASFAWQAWDNVHCQGVGCTLWVSASFAWQAWDNRPRGWMYSLTHLLNPSLTHSLPPSLTHSLYLNIHTHTHKLTYLPTYIPPSSLHHSHTSSSLLAFSAQSKSKEVGNMWGYPVL